MKCNKVNSLFSFGLAGATLLLTSNAFAQSDLFNSALKAIEKRSSNMMPTISIITNPIQTMVKDLTSRQNSQLILNRNLVVIKKSFAESILIMVCYQPLIKAMAMII